MSDSPDVVPPPKRSLRPLKYLVQPVWLLDDGTDLAEIPGETFSVSPAAWRTFATEGIAQALARAIEAAGLTEDAAQAPQAGTEGRERG